MIKYSGNEIVDQMQQISITGNVIPDIWHKTIVKEKGTPHFLAISILGDVCYWYRPREIRDEGSGQIIEYRKKFKGDLLQRSYAQLMEKYNLKKPAIRDALELLERIGVVERVCRDIETDSGGKLRNVMFLKLNPQALLRITYPDEVPDDGNTEATEVVQKNAPRGVKKYTTSYKKTDHVGKNNTSRGTEKCMTNTENTTKSTTEISDPFLLEEKIRKQIGYQMIVEDRPELFCEMDSIVEIILEVMMTDNTNISIEGKKIQTVMVRHRLEKLDRDMVMTVLEKIKDKRITGNPRKYLLTLLYNEPVSFQSKARNKTSFQSFHQRDYDFEQLEKEMFLKQFGQKKSQAM